LEGIVEMGERGELVDEVNDLGLEVGEEFGGGMGRAGIGLEEARQKVIEPSAFTRE
jgi:hypothetical protein